MKQKICLKKLNSILVENAGESYNPGLATTFVAAMMSYGYIPSRQLFDTLSSLSEDSISALYKEVIPHLANMKGADVKHKPMYPNFPKQVMEASYVELFRNAFLHYFTFGQWTPDYQKLPRDLAFENVKFRELGLAEKEELLQVFSNLVSSQESLSDEDKQYVQWFLDNEPGIVIPETIPYKETLCIIAAYYFRKLPTCSQSDLFLQAMQGKRGLELVPSCRNRLQALLRTATDVLRLATYLNGGDVSLSENTKFKSMPRIQRRLLAEILEKVATEEDIARHRNKWVRLFHTLHIGDYSDRLFALAKKPRNNERMETYVGKVQECIKASKLKEAVELLTQRPGEFARRLDHLFRLAANKPNSQQSQISVVSSFLKVVDQVPTRVVTQLMGHFKNRVSENSERVVFPKGKTQHAMIIPSLEILDKEPVNLLMAGLEATLWARFSQQEPLGKVWIDPLLKECPIPSQQRSASEGAISVARGTRLPIGDDKKTTLRFFIYWKGRDIDLSASLHDENFKLIEHISYTHLRSSSYQACHSGDITWAPEGASEFIDITMAPAAKMGARYVVMNVFVFSGPAFAEHEICYAGWMTRSQPNSNEIYEPTTVEQKVDLRANAKNAIPVVFDLVERKAIWTDLATGESRAGWMNYRFPRGNNIENNRATIEQTLKAIVKANSKMSLYDLFQLHAKSRGTLVENQEEAETIFGFGPESKVTPYDLNVISSQFLI